MFQSARLKLTAWYILIIALISFLFSIAFYKSYTREFDRIRRIQIYRVQHPNEVLLPPNDFIRRIDPSQLSIQTIDEAEERIALTLIVINLAILTISSIASYFLAGRTLGPIKEMVDDQNRFITDSSHELRTPLTSLKAEIEVNLRDKNLNLENAKQLLKSNLEEVNNLQSLSDNLIKLTQFNKANTSNQFETTSLKNILEDAIKKITNLAKHKNISLQNLAKDYTLYSDKQNLTEAFVILLDNSIKYSHKNSQVTITSKKMDHTVTISVIDQGIGISSADIPHLFDRFYRADKSRTKKDYPGYGLGLSIAKQIIDNHSGTIKVSSIESKGTTFFIQLPIKRA